MNNKIPPSVNHREGFFLLKLRFLWKILWGRTRGADAFLDKFADFDVVELRRLTGKRLFNLIVDIDGCIAPGYGEILPENIEKIRELIGQGVGVGIYSNASLVERLKPLADLGVKIYDGKYPKPMAEGFLEACEEFGFGPAVTWMIGDNPATDGGAVGVLEGMAFVKPIKQNSKILDWRKRLSLVVQKTLRAVALWITRVGNKNLLTSEDLVTIKQ